MMSLHRSKKENNIDAEKKLAHGTHRQHSLGQENLGVNLGQQNRSTSGHLELLDFFGTPAQKVVHTDGGKWLNSPRDGLFMRHFRQDRHLGEAQEDDGARASGRGKRLLQAEHFISRDRRCNGQTGAEY